MRCPRDKYHKNIKPFPVSYSIILKRRTGQQVTIYLKNAPGLRCNDCIDIGLTGTYPDKAADQAFQSDIFPTILSKLQKISPINNELCLDLAYSGAEPSQKHPFRIFNPKISFANLVFPENLKTEIERVVDICRNSKEVIESRAFRTLLPKGRCLVFNFHGPPGTGKSATVEAIAKELGPKLLSVSYPELESKYVGDTPKNIKFVFQTARDNSVPILFDEADSFLSKRVTNITQSADYGVNISRSVLLDELERHDGIVFFCTNLLKNYDRAFERRIFYSLEFKQPELEVRTRIFRHYLKECYPNIGELPWEIFAREAGDGFTGADIVDSILMATFDVWSQGKVPPNEAQILSGIDCIKQRKIEDDSQDTSGKIEQLVNSDGGMEEIHRDD